MSETLSPQDVDNYRWLTNLMLADRMARAYGVSRPAAIRRCARRMRDKTVSEVAFGIAKLLIEKPDDYLAPYIERRVADFEQRQMLNRKLPEMNTDNALLPASKQGLKQWLGGAQ
jgi:hypothetical protein